MEREKKDLSFILILLSTLIGIAVLFQWAIVTGLYTPQRNPSAWEKLMEKDILIPLCHPDWRPCFSLSDWQGERCK